MEAETGTSEDSEEKSSEKEGPWAIIREAMEKLLEFEEKVDKGRKDTLNTILEGISGFGATYDERLTELEEDIKELKSKEGKEKGAAFDFISSKEEHLFSIDIDAQLEDDLNNEIFSGKLKDEFKTEKGITLSENVTIIKEKEDRWTLTNEEKIYCIKKQDGKFLVYERSKGVVETLSSVQKEHLEKIVKTLPEESEIVDLKDKIDTLRGTGLLGITDDKLKGITTVLDYIKQAPSEGNIEKITNIGDIIEKMEQNGKNIPKKEDLEKLEKISFSKGMAALISAEAIETFKAPLLDRDMTLKEILERVVSEASKPKGLLEEIRKELKPFKIESSYRMGIVLLKKKEYEKAKNCFEEIINQDSNLKGAWLNKGVALGGLCEIEEEIKCYGVILNTIDENYKKAFHNKKIAERKMRRTK